MSTTHDFHAAATCSGIDPGVFGRASRPVVTGCRRRASASVQSPPCFSAVAPSRSYSTLRSCAGSAL